MKMQDFLPAAPIRTFSGPTDLMTPISIIICTRDRASDLTETLAAMRGVDVPKDISAELIVVDNGSTDDTAALIHNCTLDNLPIRYLSEPQPGKSRALNTGLRAANGDIFLFTDDDVRPPKNWIDAMCRPIITGAADAVCGGVRFAPHLERDWLTRTHREWLADTQYIAPVDPGVMIGANMASSRRVLDKVNGFDRDMGPGSTVGNFEDVLISAQIAAAGYKIVTALDVAIEHHFHPDRLTRTGFIRAAEIAGRSGARLRYRWHHDRIFQPRLRLLYAVTRLALYRFLKRPSQDASGPISEWEIKYLAIVYFYKQYLEERKHSRRNKQGETAEGRS